MHSVPHLLPQSLTLATLSPPGKKFCIGGAVCYTKLVVQSESMVTYKAASGGKTVFHPQEEVIEEVAA